VAQVHAAPHVQPESHLQFTALDSQLQEGAQVQALLLHSFFIGFSGLVVLTTHTYREALSDT
jgi:hypothetical protein